MLEQMADHPGIEAAELGRLIAAQQRRYQRAGTRSRSWPGTLPVVQVAYALSQLDSDLADAAGKSVVVLVSDGEETCGGDPCKAVDELAASGLDDRVHVIGHDIDDPAISGQLACIAEVTDGSYHPAANAEQLTEALLRQ